MDYQVFTQVSCDINSEKCFVTECDLEDVNFCDTDKEGKRVRYYKVISKNASNISECRNSEDKKGCEIEYSCVQGEDNCYYQYCTKKSNELGENCAVSNTE